MQSTISFKSNLPLNVIKYKMWWWSEKVCKVKKVLHLTTSYSYVLVWMRGSVSGMTPGHVNLHFCVRETAVSRLHFLLASRKNSSTWYGAPLDYFLLGWKTLNVLVHSAIRTRNMKWWTKIDKNTRKLNGQAIRGPAVTYLKGLMNPGKRTGRMIIFYDIIFVQRMDVLKLFVILMKKIPHVLKQYSSPQSIIWLGMVITLTTINIKSVYTKKLRLPPWIPLLQSTYLISLCVVLERGCNLLTDYQTYFSTDAVHWPKFIPFFLA